MYIIYIGIDFWLLTTDPGSQLAHQALIECAHPVLPAGDLLLRPTSLYLQYTYLYFVHMCSLCSDQNNTLWLCTLLSFTPFLRYFPLNIFLFLQHCTYISTVSRPISFSFLIRTSENVNITDYYTDRHVGLYGFYWSAHLVSLLWFLLYCLPPWFLLWCCSPWFLLYCLPPWLLPKCCSPWFLLWCCSPWFLLWCSFRSGSMSLAHTQTHPPTINQTTKAFSN